MKNNISFWHVRNASEPKNKPTGHTLSSQVCCVNHFFPIRHDKNAVLELAKLFLPGTIDVFEISTDKYMSGYVQFESVSDRDYLNEKYHTRGSNCTSIDALIYGLHSSGQRYIIPIEWKYTENYGNTNKSIEDRPGPSKVKEGRGKERLHRYSGLINNSKYLKRLRNYRNSVYYFEPFYQLMRQTLWAEQMIENKDTETIKADNYMHIHIIPSANAELLEKIYKPSEKKMEETWLDCLQDKTKYKIVDPKELLKKFDKEKYCDLIQYLERRYWGE